jgi:hypothetical protein
MRNAALVLGIIGGLIGMVIGLATTGYIELVDFISANPDIPDVVDQMENATLIRVMGLLAPLLALAGGAMSKMRALWGGALMLLSAAGMYWAFGYSVFTMFPIAMCALGGVLALAAGKPDEPKAHF